MAKKQTEDRLTPWNPCMPHASILNERQEIFLTKNCRERRLMAMAQVDILVEEIMEESQKTLGEVRPHVRDGVVKAMRKKLAP